MIGKIGVVGDRDSILCFKTLGLDVFEAGGQQSIRRTINRMAKEKYAVIFITEHAAIMAEETINKYKSLPYPAIILIPSNKGNLGIGMKNIRKNVEKAIGTDIFLDN